MVAWEEFFARVEEKVNDIISNTEAFEGSLDFSKIMGDVLKEFVMDTGDIKRKVVGEDVVRGIAGKNVLYRDDSIRKITGVKG